MEKKLLAPAFLLATVLLTGNLAVAETTRIDLGWMNIQPCTRASFERGIEYSDQTIGAYVEVDAPNASEIQNDLKECALQGAAAAGLTAIFASPSASMPAFEAAFSSCVADKADEYSSISLGVTDSQCHWDDDGDDYEEDPVFGEPDVINYSGNYINEYWSVPNKAFGVIRIAASKNSRSIYLSCDGQAQGQHNDVSWVQLQISSQINGINYTSERINIDNASVASSGTLSGYIPANTEVDISIKAPNRGADAEFLRCTTTVR